MSVVTLTLDGEQATVVDTHEAFERAGGADKGRAILIMNLDVAQLRPPNDANVTYDLRVGTLYRDHRHSAPATLEDGQSITLLPGAAVIVQSEEWVRLPRSMFGHVVPKVSLLQVGVTNTSSKVDPGYDGPLLVTVFNLGKQVITLGRRDPFCALYVLRVEGTARLYSKPGKTLEGKRVHMSPWAIFSDWLQRRDAFVKTLIGFFTLMLGVLGALRSLGWIGP
jgi:deoxycytidine triphosphate deaminase